MANRPDDIELMQRFDGELPAPEGEQLDAGAEAVMAGLAEVSEAVRTHLELATDEADSRLERLWSHIERGIEPPAPAAAVREPASSHAQPDDGLMSAVGRWLERQRTAILAGGVAAVAAAALTLVLRPPDTIVKTEIVRVADTGAAAGPIYVSATPPVVENLDVSDGSGTVLTIPGDEGENPTTVIWVSRDDIMEGPI